MLLSKWRKETGYGIVEEKARGILKMRYPNKNEMFKIEDFNFLRAN